MKKVQDHYFEKAKQDRYVARSVYKLKEIQEKQPLLHAGNQVLELGCTPGSWMQYTLKIIGPKGLWIGVDLQDFDLPLPANAQFIQGDILELELDETQLKTSQFDVILSDMAPKTTGIRQVDADRSAQLCEMALLLAEKWLKPGGFLLMKIFQGAGQQRLMPTLRKAFNQVKIIKPKSSRDESTEIFLLCKGMK